MRNVVAVVTVVFALLLGTASTAGAASIPLRVLTYNIWGLPSPASHATWRYAEIAKRLREYDVVAFEETWSSDTDVVWKANKKTHPYVAFGGQAHGLVGASGLIVISKFPIVEQRFEAYHDCADIECTEKKGFLYFRVRVRPGVEVDFYATHTNAWQDQSAVRSGQIMQLVGSVLETSVGRPFVVLGDFNSEFRSINYDEIWGNLFATDSYEENLRHIPHPTPEQRNGYTFDIDKNPWAAPSYSNEDHPQRLDYIFYRDTAEARMSVLDSQLAFTEPVQGDKPLSDHYGLTTLFQIDTRPE